MNHDEQDFREKLQKFSVVKKCPRCGQLALTSNSDSICCSNCGYKVKFQSIM